MSHPPSLTAAAVDDPCVALGHTQHCFDALERLTAQHPGDSWVRSPQGDRQLVLRSLDLIRTVLIRDYKSYGKGRTFANMKLLMGDGLIVQEGDVWRRQRYMMQPMFHDDVLGRTSAVIRRHALGLGERWEHAARRGTPVDLVRDVSRAVLDTLLESIFGDDLARVGRGTDDPFGFLVDDARELSLVPRFRRAMAGVDEVVQQRLRYDRLPPDLLSMLIAARDRSGEPMTVPRIRDEVATLLIAGHETTASMLAWTWYELAAHPEIHAQLRRDADDAGLGRASSPAIPRLPYADEILLEVLRLYPPVWLEDRVALEDVELGPWSIPRGTELFIPIYFVHRDPRHFPQPHRFWPERFEDHPLDPRYAADIRGPDAPRASFGAGGTTSAFMPFSLGPRRCIGDRLVILTGRLHLGLLAPRLSLHREGAAELTKAPRVNLRPTEGVHMRAVVRGADDPGPAGRSQEQCA
ncbi:MAG: cytochrome P450 [Nannocystaceae bacterium]